MSKIEILNITPAAFEAMYRDNGLLPTTGHGGIVNGCCCALGVLAVHLKGVNKDQCSDYQVVSFLMNDRGIKRATSFGIGFDSGFKNYKENQSIDFNDEYVHGHKVGVYIRKAFSNKP